MSFADDDQSVDVIDSQHVFLNENCNEEANSRTMSFADYDGQAIDAVESLFLIKRCIVDVVPDSDSDISGLVSLPPCFSLNNITRDEEDTSQQIEEFSSEVDHNIPARSKFIHSTQ